MPKKLKTVLEIIVLLAGAVTAIIKCTDKGTEFWNSLKDDKNNTISKTSISLSGSWKMEFDFNKCDNPQFYNKNFKCYYSINLFPKDDSIVGNGVKHSETFNGKLTKYAHTFPIRIEGTIKEGQLIANCYESNTVNEVTGIIKIKLDKKWIYSGTYEAKGKNCDGDIKLERDVLKPNVLQDK